MDPSEQQRALDKVAAFALAERCFVAPVGSVYFLLRGSARTTTKDIDIVLHDADFEPPPLDIFKRIGQQLGDIRTTPDGAVIQVRTHLDGPAEIELIRGRSTAKGGFFPRGLLREAAKDAVRKGNILIYPIEYVIALKADGAIDREDRAKRDPSRAGEHERRANAFRADVFNEVNAALLRGELSATRLQAAIGHLKKSRRGRITQLLTAAGAEI